MTTEYHHVPSTNRLLDKYETLSTSSHNEIFNGDYINLTKHPKPISNSININTNKKSHFMNNSFDRDVTGHVFVANGGNKQQQEFELTERRSQSFKNRPRTNSTNDTIDTATTNANRRAYSPKKKLQQGNSTSHDTIASSLKRIINAGKEKLSPSHILDTNNKEYIYKFKANRSLSNNSYTGGSVYAHDIDDDEDDDEEEEIISDEDAQSERKTFLNENDKKIMRIGGGVGGGGKAPLDDAEKTSAEYGPLDSSGSSHSSSPSCSNNNTDTVTATGGPSNNLNRLNLIDTITTPNILIMDGKASLNSINKSPSSKIIKRNDSIRMRHNSSNNLAVNARNSFSDVAGGGGGKSGSKREKLRRALKKFNRAGSGVSQKRQNFIIVVILCIVNLLNYIDRFTLAGK
jgi:hypothetical protein